MIDENVSKIKDILIIMIKAGAFQVKNGKVVLNFDYSGELMNIQVEQLLYKKLKSKDEKTISNPNEHKR
jgi:hypothetical protein